jgi:DNA-binding MarR family transcriptional regulator
MSLSQVFGYLVTQANLVSLENFERAVGRPCDLRPVEYTMLQLLREGQFDTPSQLAKELRMTAPSVSVWLDKLVARKLLLRNKSLTDGRAQQLQLTAAGKKLIEQAHEGLLKSEQTMLAVLSPAERAMLLELLAKLGTN